MEEGVRADYAPPTVAAYVIRPVGRFACTRAADGPYPLILAIFTERATMVIWDKAVMRFAQVLAYLGGAAIVVLAIHVLLDATLRALLDAPLDGTLIYSQYWYMVVLGFGGWAYAAYTNQHIDAPLFGDRVAEPWRTVWEIIIQLSALVFLTLVLIYSWNAAVHAFQISEYQGSHVPVWPSRFFFSLATLAFLAVVVLRFVIAIRRLLRGGPTDSPPADLDTESIPAKTKMEAARDA